MEHINRKKGLNIAVDSLALLSPTSKNRGIGNYFYNQFDAILSCDSINNYYFFNIIEKLDDDFSFFKYSNFHEEYFYCGFQNFLFTQKKYEEIIGNLIRAFIRKYHIDVFYITSPFESIFFTYKKEWFDGVKVVATVYDIIPYMMGEHYFKFVDKNWYMNCIEMLRDMDVIFVISQSVKDDMVKCLAFPEDKIKVIWGAAGKEYRKIDIGKLEKEELYNKFGISQEFIMCTGGDDERKNIDGLIKAYAGLSKELKEKYQLVIVCKLSAASVERYTKLSHELDCDGKVILTNFVEFDELLALYNLATLLAFPSKYEGFGLPIVEAWMCGTAVLTSNNSSLVQIAGDACILVDPYSVKNITKGLENALTRCDLEMLVRKGKERLKLFQWENVAENVVTEINKFVFEVHKERSRIAMFTPLPPVQSGIADYSVDIINEIGQYFDIDVFIDDHYEAECEFSNGVSVYNHSNFKKMRKRYKEIVYQMGNSEMHFYMYQYVCEYPGIVVLHDLNLNGAAIYYSFSVRQDGEVYRRILSEDFDEKYTKQLMDKVEDGTIYSEVYNIIVNGYITNYAKKIIVHSDYAKEKLLEKDIKRLVAKIPLYAPKEEPEYKDLKTALNIPTDKLVLGCFGHVTGTKRAIPILKAFYRLCEEYNNLILYYVGRIEPGIEEEFNEILRSNDSFDSLVIITGYVSLNDFNNYMDCVDIALNLRYPYNGENSASVTRLLAKGKCVLVNDVGSFSEIWDTACVKLRTADELGPEKEVQEIYFKIKQLIESKELRHQYGIEAAKYAYELDLKKVGRKYRNVIENDCTACIDEEIIESIYQNMEKTPFCEKEINNLAKTLAFSKKIDFE